jgi:hypothetical protein
MSDTSQYILPVARWTRPWLLLTREEQQVLAAVLFLFLMGVCVRAWRGGAGAESNAAPATVTSERSGI